jgi:hypothetical protein
MAGEVRVEACASLCKGICSEISLRVDPISMYLRACQIVPVLGLVPASALVESRSGPFRVFSGALWLNAACGVMCSESTPALGCVCHVG